MTGMHVCELRIKTYIRRLPRKVASGKRGGLLRSPYNVYQWVSLRQGVRLYSVKPRGRSISFVRAANRQRGDAVRTRAGTGQNDDVVMDSEWRNEGGRKQAEGSERGAKGHNIHYDTLSLRHVVWLTSP